MPATREDLDEGAAEHIAIIGIAGRYPKAADLDAFWRNLRDGVDGLESVDDAELEALGIPEHLYTREDFVRRGTRLPDADAFDAAFFGFTPHEAKEMDPQARVFLETCYLAIENAGYDPYAIEVPMGIFAGSNPNDYAALLGVADPSDSLGAFDRLIGSDKDFLATRVSHRLDLRGPSMTVQTACSTSLVAVHMAVQSLLAFECDMCLAGGVAINFRQGVGYFYQEGMILSPEGRCRAFDADASGTTLGQGCGVVLLKRLEDALADRDHVYAVVRASAVNNDGGDKIGYTAPSENGQAEVIAAAHRLAGVSPDTITYVETHGTGTKLGDPVEIAGLARAFAVGTERRGYCAVGSVKTSVGHTDAAAGVTGLLKTVLSLHHRELVPSLGFERPNPAIDFEATPFRVSTERQAWQVDGVPLRAGVSAFGIGGTNAHVVLEEAPAAAAPPPAGDESGAVILPLGARSENALRDGVEALTRYLADDDRAALADVAFTLRDGRADFPHRAALVADGEGVRASVLGRAGRNPRTLVWMFSGQGSQYAGMGAELYEEDATFREALDRCADLFAPLLGFDLRELMFDTGEAAGERLRRTEYTQPALFSLSHALSAMLRAHGLRPDVLLGHSIGEFAAAVEAEILSLEDAVLVVFERGRLMQSMAAGSMLAVPLDEAALRELLPDALEIAVQNGPERLVVAGESESIANFAAALAARGIETQTLATSHAFHTRMMREASERFADTLRSVALAPPTTPVLSNVTGRRLSDEQATDPLFWASQIVSTVRFSDDLAELADIDEPAFVELGPGRTLVSLAAAHPALEARSPLCVQLLRHPRQSADVGATRALEAIARLWCGGVPVRWPEADAARPPHRVPLPGYAFDRQTYWLPSRRHVLALPAFGELGESGTGGAPATKRKPAERWLYVPSWQRTTVPSGAFAPSPDALTLAFVPDTEAASWSTWIAAATGRPDSVLVVAGERFAAAGDAGGTWCVNPHREEDFERLFDELEAGEVTVDRVLHAWLAAPPPVEEDDDPLAVLEHRLALGVHAAHAVARGVRRIAAAGGVHIDFLTAGAHEVLGGEPLVPEAAALLGPAKVIPLEFSGTTCRHIDVEWETFAAGGGETPLARLLRAPAENAVLAVRGSHLWSWRVEERRVSDAAPSRLRRGGHYLVVGGLGGVGLSIAEHLVGLGEVRLVLTSRRGRPAREGADAETLRRIELLERLEADAAGLEVLPADIADRDSMARVLEDAESRFGTIDGVIVAAGVADMGGAIQLRSRERATDAIRSKVHGSVILLDLLRQRPSLGFVLLSSSIASVLYHNRFGQVGYVTANSFVEALAARARRDGVPVTTVAWDDWTEIGMSVRAAADFANAYGTDVDLVDPLHSFTPREGVALFEQALRSDESLLYVSTTDLNVRVENDVDAVSPFLAQAGAGESDEAGEEGTDDSPDTLVRRVWTDLLGFESFEPDADFFELGGDSLQAARMADRLSRGLGVEVPLASIFDAPRLDQLVALLVRLRADAGDGDGRSHRRAPLVGDVPLSAAQRRFLARNTPDPNLFNISVLLRPGRRVEPEPLERALGFLIEHHDSLRFRLSGSGPDAVQRALEPADVRFHLRHDAAPVAIEVLEREAAALQRTLHLQDGPLFAARLFELADGEQRLLLTVHHMVSDRVSLFLLLDALEHLWGQVESGAPFDLGPRTADFGSWTFAQRERVERDEALVAWLSDRAWHAVRPLPARPGATPADNVNRSARSFDIRMPPMAGISPQSVLHGLRADELIVIALGQAVARWSDAEASLIEALGHGRRLVPDCDVSRTTGFFLSYQPLVLERIRDASPRPIFDGLRTSYEMAAHHDTVRDFHPEASVRERFEAHPRAEVLFNYVGRAITTDEKALFQPVTDAGRGQEVDPMGRRDHALAVLAEAEDDGAHRLVFVYSEALFEEADVRGLAEQVIGELDALLAAYG